VRLDGLEPLDEWSSLVDPQVPIPPEIQALTGITSAMLRGAPRFADLLPALRERLDGRILVAHNARFDYGFLKAEFRRAGQRLLADLLCTVRLSRRLWPSAPSHRLDALVERHGLPREGRHRALGDARLVAAFLQAARRESGPDTLSQAIADLLRQPATPPHLPAGALDGLPDSPGVYTFIGATGQPLYVGKARDLRRRVRAHFHADSRHANDARLAAEAHALTVETTAGEFGALLLEIRRIKGCAPLHNRALRRRATTCFLRAGRPGLPPRAVRLADLPGEHPLAEPGLFGPFGSRAGARAALSDAGRSHRLCDRAIGLSAGDGPCFSRQIRRCAGCCTGEEPAQAHHARLLAALAPWRFPDWPYSGPIEHVEVDADTGRADLLRFDRWCALGPDGPEPFDPDVYRLLARRLARAPHAFREVGTAD